MAIEFKIPIKPKAKARPRFSKFGGAYTPKETKQYEEFITNYVKSKYKDSPLSFALSVSFIFCFKHKTKRSANIARPDLDNLIKAVCDALNGILWDDDSLIAHMSALKVYDDEDCIILSVNPLLYQYMEESNEKVPPGQSIQ